MSAENLNTKQAREEIRFTINIAVDKTTHVAESIASYNIADSGASNSENTIFVTALEEKLPQIMNFVKSNTSPKSDFASLIAAIASNLRTISAEKWIFDTGASNHMTSHFSWLTEKDRLKHVATVELLKGNITNITHVGNYILNNEIELKGTLCVPEFKFNILSISKLTTNMKCYVTFFFFLTQWSLRTFAVGRYWWLVMKMLLFTFWKIRVRTVVYLNIKRLPYLLKIIQLMLLLDIGVWVTLL